MFPAYSVRYGRAAITAAFFAQGFGFAVVLTHLDSFKDHWGVSNLEITLVILCVALLAAVGSLIAERLSKHRGSQFALRFGLGCATVALLVTGVAPVFPIFCLGLGIYGLALGSIDASSNMQAVACEAIEGRSILTSFYAAWSAGGILGALETSGTAALAWPLVLSISLPAIIPFFVAWLPFLPSHTQAGDMALNNTISNSADATDKADLLHIPWKLMAVFGAAIVLFYVADSATQTWSTIYLSGTLLASATLAPIGYAAYQGTSLVSRLLGDHFVRRMGAAAVVRIAAIVGAVGLLIAMLAPTPWVAIIGFGILGLGIAVVAPLSFAAAGRLADTDAAGNPIHNPAIKRRKADAIIARVNEFNYLGFVLGSVVTGLVTAALAMRQGFVVPLIGILLILPLARFFSTEKQRR